MWCFFKPYRYVAWNVHESVQGQYNFEGNNDLVQFIKTANTLGLLVVLRPGGYIIPHGLGEGKEVLV